MKSRSRIKRQKKKYICSLYVSTNLKVTIRLLINSQQRYPVKNLPTSSFFFSRGSLALEVYQGKVATFRKKQFGRNTWKFLRLEDMTYEDEQKAYFYARDNIIGKPFNFSGFIRCIFPLCAA